MSLTRDEAHVMYCNALFIDILIFLYENNGSLLISSKAINFLNVHNIVQRSETCKQLSKCFSRALGYFLKRSVNL